MKTVIHWFRRDLRITDNTALAWAAEHAENVIPVYVVSDWKKSHGWTGPHRQQFLCESLASLDGNLRSIGSRLVIRQGDAVTELTKLATETGAEAIVFNRDPDPFGRAVEKRLVAEVTGCEVRDFKDVAVFERNEVLTGSGDPYRVYSPYARAWYKLPRPAVTGRLRELKTPDAPGNLPLPTLETWGLAPTGSIVPGGERAARDRLSAFLDNGIESYGAKRNFPAGQTSSRISQDLRYGLLSIRETFQRCETRAVEFGSSGRGSAQKFLNELVWREFYMQILWHYPEVLEHEFNPKYRGMKWPGTESDFQRWCSGETGFPFVDAAMRQLNATGFMHNRTRMVTAMFLTKDLHIDWRRGEQYFMQQLTDGEIASNNGGWQWSAGCGADAAPYFRIQNPWTQTERFDPQGEYIKEWVPELRDVTARLFTKPPDDGRPLAPGYPAPMVDHAVARERTLALFKVTADQAEPDGVR